jgi:hypothetical protein
MKYKLIKEYPGSPNLGTVAEKESKIKSNTSYYYSDGDKRWCIYDYHVEDNPEYWEKVNENLWYVVSKRNYQEGNMLFQEWFIYTIETCFSKDNGVLLYFKTKEEAEEYILYNKPCLCLNNIRYLLDKEQRSTVELFIKSKL